MHNGPLISRPQSFWDVCFDYFEEHYNDVIIGMTASQITSFMIVYSTVYSGADQWKHESSVSLAFVQGIHRGPVNSQHKWPVTWKMFAFDDVIKKSGMGGPNNNTTGLIIPSWMSNYIHFKVWDEIVYPLPNFNGAIVKVCEWISIIIHILLCMRLLICAEIKINPC